MKPFLVGMYCMYRGIILQEFLKWCEMDFVHPQGPCWAPLAQTWQLRVFFKWKLIFQVPPHRCHVGKHGCCWETFYIVAYCGLVRNAHLTAKMYFVAPFQHQPSLPRGHVGYIFAFKGNLLDIISVMLLSPVGVAATSASGVWRQRPEQGCQT